MRGVEVSGFGINCKSTIAKQMCNEVRNLVPVMSDSAIIADMATRYWSNWDPEERCRFRYHQMASTINYLPEWFQVYVDRGIVDQICFARLIDKGAIPRVDWDEQELYSPNYKFLDEYIDFELDFPLKRFFIYTKNRKLVEATLSNEHENHIEKRSFYSKNVDKYFELQELFFREYVSIIPEYGVLFLEDDIDNSISKIISRLKQEL